MRKPRVEYPGALFHVIARGNQRQRVFLDDGDRVRYLRFLGERLESRDFSLYAYCLMDNHVHLLIERGADYPLSKYMQRLQGAYTGFFNRKHRKIGHLFQGRYKSILVDKENYLLELVRYIHLNPHRAGLEKADLFPWTSHRQYMGSDRESLAMVKTDVILSMFSKVKVIARKRYLAFMKEKEKEAKWNPLYTLRDGRFLGDEDFENETYEKAELGQRARLMIKTDVEGLWKSVLEREGLKAEPVGQRRSHLIAETAYLATEGAGIRQKEVAEYFSVEPTALNMAVKRLELRWQNGVGSRRELERWARKVNCEA